MRAAPKPRLTVTALSLALLSSAALYAPTTLAQRSTQAIIDEVLVTARKRSDAEAVQDTPIAVTAYGADQLEALQFRDLSSLSYSMPNVSLDDVGTSPGVANFSIRGLGINSSIPSIDPTVGVFIDGMYLGINGGVVLDMFDLEAIEVLRGPQGILFGRNVTGGAVVVRTAKPTDTFEATAKVAGESRNNMYYMGSVSGPLVEGLVNGKLSAYLNEDEGWHKNKANDNNHYGQARTRLFRPSLSVTPTDSLEILLRYEHGKSAGDGPASQNRALFDRDTFDIANDEEGFYENRWQHAIVEINQDVAFGNGTITNILAWREFDSRGISDIDATPNHVFHAGFGTDQDQISNELRYAGRFMDRMNVTTGIYYFEQEIRYQENRSLATPNPGVFLNAFGGGIQEQETYGIFAQADYELNSEWTVTVGARYTYEEKDVRIGSLNQNLSFGPPPENLHKAPPGSCNVVKDNCNYNFRDDESWSNFTPKLGFQWVPQDNLQFYGFWTQGVRSGGYNLRNTDPNQAPGPFDEELQNSYELGMKYDTPDARGRLNIATFYNEIDDMQREVNRPDGVFGVSQVVRNTADARVYGIEMEGRYLLLPNLVLTGSAGYLKGEYTKIHVGLTDPSGAIAPGDKDLDIPRLAPWTASAGINYDQSVLDDGFITYRISYSYRDEAAYTDNNLGTLNEAHMLGASITLGPNTERWTLSIYGNNLLDEVTEGGDTQLPPSPAFGGPGATFSPLNKGRVIGGELKYRFH